MYKILLVDDEEDVRHAIAERLDWASLGFVVSGEAGNGLEALDMLENFVPDVIVADIQMPFMDGLTLCRRAREIIPDVKLVIFSGFDEFEYAREAIKLEVVEYIMKPIDAVELTRVLARVRESLDREIEHQRDFERYRKLYQENIPTLRRQYLENILEGKVVDDEKWQSIGEDIQAERYGLVCVSCADTVEMGFSEEEERLLPLLLKGMICEAFEGSRRFLAEIMNDGIVILFLMREPETMRGVIPEFQRIVLQAKKSLGIKPLIGLGKSFPDRAQIPASYAGALDALARCDLTENGQIIYKGDTLRGSKEELVENGKAYIEEHYRDPVLSLEDIANALYVSQPYFSFVFKKTTGQSVISWLTNVRLRTAMDLLRNTNEKTYRIAELVGYQDPNYFSYVFKKNIGIPPTTYRTKLTDGESGSGQ
jgi:two-component system response regulator YesN